ncbi:hypothetical protein [Spiroplasma endosymbiont of Melieria omissa]
MSIWRTYCNSKIFESYVKNKLIPVLKRGQIIVLDNATFHKSINGNV